MPPVSEPLADIVGHSPAIAGLRRQIRTLLGHQGTTRRLPTVLILGETGVGKGLLARAMHRASQRAAAPFVAVNCAAIPETLVESELFGFERGAFTDARQAKAGLLQSADGGTLFLDEIGALPFALQAKLLTALEDRQVRRIGSTRSEPVDIWVLAATSEDLMVALRSRRFRADLYYRLATVTFTVPPLRDRRDDISTLADHFLSRTCAEYGLPAKRLTSSAYEVLLRHHWSGNVRELANVMERAALLADSPAIQGEHLGLGAAAGGDATCLHVGNHSTVKSTVQEFERTQLLAALESTDWNLSRAAVRLGVPRNTLRYRMQRLSLQRQPVAAPASPPRPTPGEPERPASHWQSRPLTFLHVSVELGGLSPTSTSTNALRWVMDKIGAFGGRIEEIGASDVVAVFGLEPMEDATPRAAHAVLAVRAALRHAAPDGTAPTIRAAIHVSRAFVGTLAGEAFTDPADKVAAGVVLRRLLDQALPDTTIVSGTAGPFLERRFVLSHAPPSINGDGGRTLLGLETTGLGIGGRPLTRFVGRERELQALRDEFGRALAGHGRVVALTGEPGSGKSRLLYEFRQEIAARAPGAVYVEAYCTSYGTVRPYGPFVGMIRRLCGIGDAESPEAAAGKVHDLTASLPDFTSSYVAHLLDVLQLHADLSAATGSGPESIRAQTFAAVTRLCLHLAMRGPFILAVEDLHWSDPTSVALLTEIVAMADRVGMLLLTTARPGTEVPWRGSPAASELTLSPLSSGASLEVVRWVLGERAVRGDVTERIVARAGGNPFFLEEQALAVREHGTLRASEQVPPTIEGLLRARIDRLAPSDQRLLHIAAVLGGATPLGLLATVAEQSPEVTGDQLGRLVAAELLRESRGGPEPIYGFRHVLTRDVAYESAASEARRAIHGAILRIREADPASRRDEVERLAFHALRAEEWERAIGYFREAATRAFARSSNREALACLQQALEAVERLPETRATLELGVELRFDLRAAFFLLGQISAVETHLREAARLAQRLDDPLRLGRAWVYMTHYHWITGELREARVFAELAQRVATRSGDELLELTTRLYIGLAHHGWGEFRASARLLGEAVDSLTGARSRQRFGQVGYPGVLARGYLVFCLADLGAFEQGVALGTEGIEIAEAVGHPYSLGIVSWDLAYLHCVKGDVPTALALAQRCAEVHDLDRQGRREGLFDPVETARRSAFVLSAPRVLWLFGHVYALGGRVAEGIALLEEAQADFAKVGMRVYDVLVAVHLGEAYLGAGRLADAQATAERALALADARQQRGHRAYALRLLAEVTAADDRYREALDEARALGMRPLEARCHLGLGMLGRRAGGPEAGDHLARAAALFQDLGMRVGAKPLPL
jgi:DNA-binding NtrC family response regulator/tetratricopeptide (TPR) repeat protein